jgi:hypothetical protein
MVPILRLGSDMKDLERYVMKPEELLKIDPEKASAAECLALMKMAHDDLKKAKEGNLFTPHEIKIVPHMYKWGMEVFVFDDAEKICPACLAGCTVASRFSNPNQTVWHSYKSTLQFAKALDFLDNCRYLSDKHPNSASEILMSIGVNLPYVDPIYHDPGSADDVLLMLEKLLQLNSHLMSIAIDYGEV